jgi:hypothetical protein
MSRQPGTYQYFTLPLASVPQQPSYRVWFSSWLPHCSDCVWSERRPNAADATAWAVGATEDNDVPADATVIIPDAIKCIPPPPLALPSRTPSAADFQSALTKKLTQELLETRSL